MVARFVETDPDEQPGPGVPRRRPLHLTVTQPCAKAYHPDASTRGGGPTLVSVSISFFGYMDSVHDDICFIGLLKFKHQVLFPRSLASGNKTTFAKAPRQEPTKEFSHLGGERWGHQVGGLKFVCYFFHFFSKFWTSQTRMILVDVDHKFFFFFFSDHIII